MLLVLWFFCGFFFVFVWVFFCVCGFLLLLLLEGFGVFVLFLMHLFLKEKKRNVPDIVYIRVIYSLFLSFSHFYLNP